MMMRYAPFTSALDDKHGEARGTWYQFALYHSGKRVKASNNDSIIVDYNCAPFFNRVLVACSLNGREVLLGLQDRFYNIPARPFRVGRTRR
jgi:hypothetical protein